jgi:hypothetical protein
MLVIPFNIVCRANRKNAILCVVPGNKILHHPYCQRDIQYPSHIFQIEKGSQQCIIPTYIYRINEFCHLGENYIASWSNNLPRWTAWNPWVISDVDILSIAHTPYVPFLESLNTHPNTLPSIGGSPSLVLHSVDLPRQNILPSTLGHKGTMVHTTISNTILLALPS